MIKLALSDMDNTLVPFGEQHVSDEVLEAIREVRAAGVQFGPATGRDEQELHRFFKGDESAYATGVISNGKKVKIEGELVSVTCLDNEALQRLAIALHLIRGCFVNAYPLKTTVENPAYVLGANLSELGPYEQRFKFNGVLVNALPDEPMIAATIAVPGGDEMLDAVRRISREVAPEFDYVEPVPGWMDVIPHGVNKASAFEILIGELGISRDEVVFFGDAENDLQIMERTPNSVAVANATPAAAEAARYHIGPCVAGAVPDALREIAVAAQEGQMPAFLLGE